VILLHRLGKRVVGPFGRVGTKSAPEVADRFGQLQLVVLNRQNAVGASILDQLRDPGLCADGVDGHGATGQRQRGQQLGNGRNLVGFFSCGALAQHQAGSGGKGGNQMQGRGIHTTRTPAGLAVNGHCLGAQGGQNARHQRRNAASNCAGSISPKMCRARRCRVFAQPLQLLACPQFNLYKGLGTH